MVLQVFQFLILQKKMKRWKLVLHQITTRNLITLLTCSLQQPLKNNYIILLPCKQQQQQYTIFEDVHFLIAELFFFRNKKINLIFLTRYARCNLPSILSTLNVRIFLYERHFGSFFYVHVTRENDVRIKNARIKC